VEVKKMVLGVRRREKEEQYEEKNEKNEEKNKDESLTKESVSFSG